ncbi:MAG: hypothetical protein KGZ73_05295 [Rhizobiales bacterium]|nr:hypothetical protein [Hyphomicrobiales bacterium]
MKPEAWIAIYAAIVATSALLLNFRNWLDSRPKLHLSLMVDGMTIGGGAGTDEKNLLILTVTNRGKETTVITHMVVFQMESWYQRWRIRPLKSYLIPNPQLKGYPHNIPSDVEPYKKWIGAIRDRQDIFAQLYNGTYYVGVYASHRDRPYLKLIPQRNRKLPENTESLSS